MSTEFHFPSEGAMEKYERLKCRGRCPYDTYREYLESLAGPPIGTIEIEITHEQLEFLNPLIERRNLNAQDC